MRYRKLDDNGDYSFGHGVADFWVNQPEAVGQAANTRLWLFTGEWFLDLAEGTPWGGFPLTGAVVAAGRILGEHTQATRDVAITTRLVDTPGIIAISGFASGFEPNSRGYSFQATLDTVYGKTLRVSGRRDTRTGFIIGVQPIGA